MLTGMPFEGNVLPNAFRGTPNAQTVDSWPFIWKDFKAAGYKILSIEDFPEVGTFQYRVLGFQQQPTDFYGRMLYLLRNRVGIKKAIEADMCLYGRPQYMLFLEYLHEFLRVYGTKTTFSFGHWNELTHNGNEPV